MIKFHKSLLRFPKTGNTLIIDMSQRTAAVQSSSLRLDRLFLSDKGTLSSHSVSTDSKDGLVNTRSEPDVMLLWSLFASIALGLRLDIGHDRGPPNTGSNSLLVETQLLSDQSEYVGIGDGVGSAIVIGDFTQDRYADLVVTKDQEKMRSLHVLVWNKRQYAFRPLHHRHRDDEYRSFFSLDDLPDVPERAYIAGISTLDVNGDGKLDLLLSVCASPTEYRGLLLYGNGKAEFRVGQTLPGVTPGFLVLDADQNLRPDILFTDVDGGMHFYANKGAEEFEYIPWNPYQPSAENSHAFVDERGQSCRAAAGLSSNAYVDLNGDCLPDLVVATENCGLHVWLGLEQKPHRGRRKLNDQESTSTPFWKLVAADHGGSRLVHLSKSVWDFQSGDEQPLFADFNGDGSIDILVPNPQRETLSIALNLQQSRQRGNLCSADPQWQMVPYTAIDGVKMAVTNLGPAIVSTGIHVGDYNYDGLIDIATINSDTGTVEVYEAHYIPSPIDEHAAGGNGSKLTKERTWLRQKVAEKQRVAFRRVDTHPCLSMLEDPIAASFFDLDESGRQDILIVQSHGTRLIWNNHRTVEDYEFFKATGVHPTPPDASSSGRVRHSFVPVSGDTVKISYDGRQGHEIHTCSQCPQAGFLSLQSCSCLFGIRRIANYIEEMAVGGGGGYVYSWTALMPNAMAIVWPEHSASGSWHVEYFAKSRETQMLGIVLALSMTLITLAVSIAYLYAKERVAELRYQRHQLSPFAS